MRKPSSRRTTPSNNSRRVASEASPRLDRALATARAVLAQAQEIECDHGCEPGRCVAEAVRALVAPLRTLVGERAVR